MLNGFSFVVSRPASARALFRYFFASSFMLSLVRLLLRHFFLVMRFPYASFVPAFLILLSKVRGFLFFLVGAGLLSIALTACEGDGSGGSSPSSPRVVIGQSPGQEGGSSSSPRAFEVELTFAPIRGGFRIGNQSDFGNFVSLNITATNRNEFVEKDIDIAEFVDGSYDFTGLGDQSDWTFRIIGTLSDGREREVTIVFVWAENREDHEGGGIRSGINTDEDGRADSVDGDDDNDGVRDGADIDDDGDGLIEIGTAAELDGVRYALNGNGSKLSEGAALDTTGCGGAGGIRSCNGYELVADISLVGYSDGEGWQPLGHDTDSSTIGCQGDAFEGIFEGNGWTISSLHINRSSEDCVGLLGHIAAGSEIRNLSLRADRVIGRNFVGGLAGFGNDARIYSSSVEAPEVSGSSSVGGLIGYGAAWIHSSSVVVAEVSGGSSIGGLVGFGGSARIHSSSVGAGEVSGSGGDDVGGLVGYGDGVWIYSSSVVAAEVSGSGGDNVGGLVGNGGFAQIHSSSVVATEVRGRSSLGGLVGRGSGARVHSSSVVTGEVRGTGINVGGLAGFSWRSQIFSSSIVVGEVSGLVESSSVGGLVGNFGSSQSAGQVAYSYVVSGSPTAMLVGSGSGTGVASYWDSETSGINGGNHGQAKTSDELRMPTDYEGIYADWDDETDVFGDGDEPLAVWCDEDNSGSIEADEETNDNLVWDFGTSNDYPAIRCTPVTPTQWRGWWFLGETGKPQLNQTRLVDTDGDGLVDRVDRDDDNDGVGDNSDQCPTGETGWTSDSFTDKDGDGCRDAGEDTDDDNDGVGDSSDQCPIGETGWTSDSSTDNDGDGCHDESKDIDDDGDGLIEIATAAELNAVRYALDGSGRRLSEGEALDTTGCGDGVAITSCAGYELVANISLATYANADGGKGWQPLGHDTNSSRSGCQGAAFDGTFEGNGWTISDLSINRSGEDCVGLFGFISGGSEIRNLTLSAEAVIGRSRVGGLVGAGGNARIVSSSVVVGEVSGTDAIVGGLVGFGNSAWIHSSSVVAGKVNGIGSWIGGLVGYGGGARIHSSSVVVGEVRGDSFVGGLVGYGWSARVHSSSAVVNEVKGSAPVGGLVGLGRFARVHSSSVVVNEVSGIVNVGGLVGGVGTSGSIQVAYSYVVSGSNTNVLVGTGSGVGVASYWDSETSGINSGNLGEAKTSDELRMPIGYTGIYDKWDNDTDIFGNGEDVPLAVWCDEDNSGSIEAAERADDNRVWDFGTSNQYPAIRCTPITPTEWRGWWFLDGGSKPRLDKSRLDELLLDNGIQSRVDTDRDGQTDSVDEDDDNDGVNDISDQCLAGDIGWESDSSTDHDGDGCRDAGEDPDDDNDGIDDNSDQCSTGETGWTSNSSIDHDGDGCRDASEDIDDDGDGVGDNSDQCRAGETGWTSDSFADKDGDGCRDESEDIDDDGDGLIEIATAAELDAVRYALDGRGRRLSESAALNTAGCGGDGGITSCIGYELVANVSLAAYSAGEGWQPLGHDTNNSMERCQGTAFAGTFDGNGWTISDLSIDRSGEDCVGLFGHMAEDSEVRNLTFSAEAVIGRDNVGGLVGTGSSARIVSTSVAVAEVSGSSRVGGLVGWGHSARIHSSSVVAAEVSGTSNVGGLAGEGINAQIYSSSVVVDEVSGSGVDLGGLLGSGARAQIYSSSVVVGEVSGSSDVGGLVGDGLSAQIFSSSVMVSELRGGSSVGGLVGNFGPDQFASQVAYSYVVSGSSTAILVGSGSGTGVASYWDSDTSGRNSGNHGQAKTSDELRMPTGYTRIYADWDDETDIFGDGNNEPLAVWCDEDNSGSIEADERTDGNRVWDFGTSSDYPAIRCTPPTPAEWRGWWFLDGGGKPQLDKAGLDKLLLDNGIQSRVDTDGDGRTDSVDADDDNDGIGDSEGDTCPAGETGWTSNSLTDHDRDGCRDAGEDPDDDNDGVGDNSDQCRVGETGWTSGVSTDKDGDGCRDADEDIDDDGDGLIELVRAAELDAVRYALDGSGRRLSSRVALDTSGCGDGVAITSCSGYELVANISLAAYGYGDGWQPLGHDTDSSTSGCDGAAFNGTFEGNGFMISDLSINRSGEDCVGLFGHVAADSEIHNLTLHAGTVIGSRRVGGLVGYGERARIDSSSVVVAEVSGSSRVGGLVGDGEGARIDSSSVVAAEVSGTDNLGGLVGWGESTEVIGSSVVVDEVSGTYNWIGGLVGWGKWARVDSSSVVANEVSGNSRVGGLLGWGEWGLIHSSSVVLGELSGSSRVGGLVGYFYGGSVVYSYVISGSNTDMLSGTYSGISDVNSYWDSDTSGRLSGRNGQARTGAELRSPTDYVGIYANWDNILRYRNYRGYEDVPRVAIWCDKDNSGGIEAAERTDDNRVWDFGTSSQYPAIRCTPITPTEWRGWWFLDGGGKPQLDKAGLDKLLRDSGIQSRVDTDGDGRTDSVDADDDNDGIGDSEGDTCPAGETGWTSDASSDHDRDGCRDAGEDPDDDNDGVNDDSDQCPIGETGWTSNVSTDHDRDGCRDANEDIDDDGDGLIELATAAGLNSVRYALSGSGIKLSEGAALDTTGCGDGVAITSCSGYELVANISLAAYGYGDGWQPLGHDTDSFTGGCQGAAFAGIFEGNGFMIGDLSISRSSEDCVGLFGHVAAGSEIRNLTLHAETVIGNRRVGGLVGGGRSARIISSSVVAAEVRGTYGYVGGLVGDGLGSQLVSSSVVVVEVSGHGSIGGLVGNGESARIVSSSVVANEVNGTSSYVGGLVGGSRSARIISSSVVVNKVRGIGGSVGGLVGHGGSNRIHSSSVVVGEVSGSGDWVGGLVGYGFGARLAYSYVVSGSNTAMLIGAGGRTGGASYWDSDASGVTSGNNGNPKTTSELRGPTGYEGIYADWDDNTDIFGDGDEPLAVWCDEDNSGSIEADERTDGNRVWDFGTSSQYPAIRCTPITPTEWRGWWFLDGGGKPQLDKAGLDKLLRDSGIQSRVDTDGDGRTDSVDEDDDNDGVDDNSDQCSTGETGWTSDVSSDHDRDGCRDADEDIDDDNDGVNDNSDQCPIGETGWTSDGSTDHDGDGCRDADEDIDDDGDGLIELATAVELNSVRHALDGSGIKLLEGAALDTTGCGDGVAITSCAGYELVGDISLAAYGYGDGWQPLGHDTDSSTSGCDGAAFDGVFEGNGFMISDLSINRSGEDCVGLFGHVAADSEIHNLTLHAGTVIGSRRVGGLVGYGERARIDSSSVVVAEVSGSSRVGGLVGDGEGARIDSSSVVAAEVSGTDNLGGLVGWGESTEVIGSSVVVDEVSGTYNWIGGLVGWGKWARVDSSSVVANEVSGNSRVGGLLGWGEWGLIHSSSVVLGELSGSSRVGGLVGYFYGGSVVYSYVISGSNTDMLSGTYSGISDVNSYWDSDTSGRLSGRNGQARTGAELRSPTDYVGIYANWDNILRYRNYRGYEDVPRVAIWCDKDNSGGIEAAERTDDNRVWDFGTSSDYPAIRCTPITPTEWRGWWFLDGGGKPQLDKAGLDKLLRDSGIQSRVDTDGDGRTDSVDEDDDNDGIGDSEGDTCPAGETGWTSNSLTDHDRDGCRDADEDIDDDNDGVNDNSDQCPIGETGWTSDGSTDHDRDGCRDADEDIDDDGDGLIELAAAAGLNSVRHALDGSGIKLSEGAALDTTGCGDGVAITSCSGYELVANISLAAYGYGDGWQPLGHDTDGSTSGCDGAAFNGTFEGNGWTISDLSINRSGEDCVGLFGHVAADSEIRNLILHAGTVIGGRRVGGLVGDGEGARIDSSLVVASRVSGTGNLGGLVGWGESTEVIGSSVVVDEVSGTYNWIGGLVGWGKWVRVDSSSVVANEVRGNSRVGGLVGWSEWGLIHSSSVVLGRLSGSSRVGGLVGYFYGGSVVYSYVISGSNTDMLSGTYSGISDVNSYWDSDTSGRLSGRNGQARTGAELRSPTDYVGIYANWDNILRYRNYRGYEDVPRVAIWCDKDNSGGIEADERTDDNRVWDFGTSSQYPAIRCTPITPTEWRGWWFLDGNGKPQLDQTRLDILLSSFEVDLTFAPIRGGFLIGNQSDFGYFVSLGIRATSESGAVEERNIDTAEFIDGSYNFTRLDDQSDWTFRIIGTLSDGREREVVMIFVWENNHEDHESGGIRPGLDTDGDRRADSVDADDDNDGVGDSSDLCEAGETGWMSNGSSDYDGDGCRDESEDEDDDNDGVGDNSDLCEAGETGWMSNGSSDYDGDGCRDESEDEDDDNDGVGDNSDLCEAGETGWMSNGSSDNDGDGCRDASSEDTDDDNDLVADNSDLCEAGETGWMSNGSSDYDGDGCRDESEDIDDDNDEVGDNSDLCEAGETGWTSNASTDNDGDGCRDESEDEDDDNDEVADNSDLCEAGETDWTSNASSDYDGDGCRDASSEDTDDDNDLVADNSDQCPTGETDWTSNTSSDYDGDGCRDESEDTDDDNDEVGDSSDQCPTGETDWTSNASSDNDGDGCRDASGEDTDDDNDLVADNSDLCEAGETGWTSNGSTDNDGDGCRDESEDIDDDNDEVADNSDLCEAGETGWTSNGSTDNDGDGCRDESEDTDDDNDGVGDNSDLCPAGETGWTSDGSTDNDRDGCRDESEDPDDDNDNFMDEEDIDDDGDGLIEIGTAAELDSVRYALDGNGRRLSGGAALNTTGCGGNGGIRSCNGYELVANISLITYANADGGRGWQPLGHDTNNSRQRCQGNAFEGTFEGNGWTISDLSINRPGEDCVGLFGYIARNSEIRNLTLRAETVIGRSYVGGLVGDGRLARIHSSSVEVGEVSGDDFVGGLVGAGFTARIVSSSVVMGEVNGHDYIGGLMGSGHWARIHSSSVVVAEVSGTSWRVGGLVGDGSSAWIVSSSVVVGKVRGSTFVGGLVGTGRDVQVHSSSVVAGEVSGTRGDVGGLVGDFGDGRVAYSYVISGSDTTMLVGSGSGTGVASYWDKETSGVDMGNHGEAKTSDELRMPTGYEGIYADWDEETDIFGDGNNEPLAVWCDKDNSGSIEVAEKTNSNRVWDFGTSSEYAAIRCTPIAPTEWRNWWFLDRNGKPQLNQTRLEELLPFEVNLTFAPIGGGFRLGNQSDFGNFISLNIIATSESGVEERNVNIVEFIDGSYDFTGLDDQSDWTFRIIGNLIDGRQQVVRIDFTWQENREDYARGGIRSGINTDGDGRADSVDEDDDNDGLDDTDAREQQIGLGGVSCSLLVDCDGDTIRDIDEVAANCVIRADCDNDGVGDISDQCPAGETSWTSNPTTDKDGDGCRDADEDTDCSNSIAGIECSIDLGGITEEFLMNEDRDYFVVDLEEAGILTLWILGSLDIEVSLLNEEEASRLRDEGNSRTVRPYDTNYVGDQYFYELVAGRYYLEIVNEGNPISLTLRTSFQPALIDSCGSARNTACRLGNFINSANGSIYSINRSIYPINDRDMFEINITEAGRLTVWLESQLDSRASLRDEDGNRLVYNDDGGYGYDFKISRTFYSAELGLYYLDISSILSWRADYPRFGPYELFVQFIPIGEEQKCELEGTAERSQPSRGADPLLNYQWYLDRIGVKEVWAQGYEGQGVHISVVDDGLDMMHEDLRENIIAGASRNYLVGEDDPSRHSPLPTDCWEDDHGTAVAGIAAARGDNGLGIKGVAPKAGIYMANYLQQQSLRSLLDAFSRKTDETLVSVNSWGSLSYTRLTKRNKLVLETIEAHLDHSLNSSISYVFTAGNHRIRQMATYQGIRNHRGAITVCATNALNSYASYSNPGINLWVCAPSGDRIFAGAPAGPGSPLGEWQRGLATTDLTGRAGYNQGLAAPPLGSSFGYISWGHFDFGSESFYYQEADYRSDYISYDGNLIAGLPGTDAYHRFFSGTSAAAPVVGGVIALIRSAYPALSWRDMKLILAESAEQVDASATSWQLGGAAYHNTSSNYTHSIDYGFGLVDAAAALDLAAEWQLLPLERYYETSERTTLFGPVNIEDTISIRDIGFDFIEHVQLEIDSSYADFGDLDIELISPRGTRSLVARSHICDRRIGEQDCADLEGGFTFASAAHLGEDPRGDWTLSISGAADPTQFDWKLMFYGHKRGGSSALDSDDDNDGVNDYLDRCPTGATGWVSNGSSDHDKDGCRDADEDIDDDGDGLIEIGTAAELDAVRYALHGNWRKLSGTADLDTTGCGGNGGISSCSGYELVANISLAAYANADGGKGWQPLGHDTDSGRSGCQGAVFDGTFEGNGWMISDLSINRPGENCVGLFGQMAANSEVRNLILSGETVIGRNYVGSLVGDGFRVRIHSSSVEVGKVSGVFYAGGLVGFGSSAQIYSSSVVVGKVSGYWEVGGLVGRGHGARIFSSSVVVDEVSGLSDTGGNSNVGGLVGSGSRSQIYSSSVLVGELSGAGRNVGGLVGHAQYSARIFSSSVVVGEVSGSHFVGGLVGHFDNGQVAYSYVVLGSNTNVLVGAGSGVGVASYWDSGTSGINSGNHGAPKTSDELRMPTSYTEIYADWDDETDIFGDGEDEPLAVWCDRDNSGSIEAEERTDDNRIWDFGTSSQYPAIRCTPTTPAEWRSWWFLDDNGKPQIDRARLVDTDGDGQKDSVDEDDDNDGINDDSDLCPAGEIGWESNSFTDYDGDGCRDESEDIDDDGDGLIELSSAVELDEVRYALDGSGRRLSEGAEIDTTGCGGDGGITSCSGYELIANISLATYAKADGGKGWQPLGNDTDSFAGCDGTAFSGTFEGNGWTISDLNISRSDEDCVGLFGYIARGATIRNLTLHAETVRGRIDVGGLVGEGRGAAIYSSSVVVGEVSGTGHSVGGLVGEGGGAAIHSSSVVAGKLSGQSDVGGLVGYGVGARIYSSSVVVGEVSGAGDRVSGLVGHGGGAQIYSSSVVVGELSGAGMRVGGLLGHGGGAQIYSSSVVAAEVSEAGNRVGGLTGSLWGQVAYSYVVSGSNTAMLSFLTVFGDSTGTGIASYWDSDTSGVSSGNIGDPKTTSDLRSPTRYAGIYENWDNGTDIFGDGEDEPLAVWCDKDHSGSIEADERTDDNRVWDFGTSNEYPAIRCTPLPPDEWRSWWFLDDNGKPQLNRTRLDMLLLGDGSIDGGSGGLQISLSWDNSADLDLHVTEPSGTRIYYGNPVSSTGGELDNDDTDGYGPENIFWSSPPNGNYLVEVDHVSGASPANYIITIRGVAGVSTYRGTISSSSSDRINVVTVTHLGREVNRGGGNGGADADNDGLNDNDPREQQTSSDGVSCSLLVDCDGDSVMDGADIDGDGDGLIEIGTAAELDEVRYALDGSGRRLSEGAELDTTGCGGASGITSCSGYELVANVSLAAYSDGKGWQPLGHDTNNSRRGCQGAAFDGTFEGNGWMISDLSINRSSEDCVGLFGHLAANSEIRNLTLHAEAVIGRNRVGGLMGDGFNVRIYSSSVVVNQVSGRDDIFSYVGGLVGSGGLARIYSSSVVAGEVRGSRAVGGLVGSGGLARVHSSSVVAGELRGLGGAGGRSDLGGLVGSGGGARIYSSSVVVNQVSGTSSHVGGLVGIGGGARIYSSSVVAGEVSGGNRVGGLVGWGSPRDQSIQLTYSYIVSGSSTDMLVGRESQRRTGIASYWDSETSGVLSGNPGEAKTSDDLRTPTDYEGIYADWDEDMDIFGDEDVPLAVWCDEDNSGSIETGEDIDDNLIWDFGKADEYPAIRCTPTTPAEWRSWWFLNATGQPQLNQTRLDEVVPSLN